MRKIPLHPGVLEHPRACEGCPYDETGGGFVPFDRIDLQRILIVGEAPGADEEVEQKGFVGKSGRLFRSIIRWAGMRDGEYAFANAVACRPPQNEFPGHTIARECIGRHLSNHLKVWGNRAVLAAGAHAIESLTGFRLPVVKARGSVLPMIGGGWIVGTLHPAFLLYGAGEAEKGQSQYYPLIGADLIRAEDALSGPFVPRVSMSTPDEVLAAFGAEKFSERPHISVDIEGSGTPNIVGVGWSPEKAYVMEWSGKTRDALITLTREGIPVFHNAAFDVPELEAVGVPIPDLWVDTINTAALVDPDVPKSLQSQVLTHVPRSVTWKDLVDHGNLDNAGGRFGVYRRLWTETLTRLNRRVPSCTKEWYSFYNGLDVAYCLALANAHRAELGIRYSYYTEIAQPIQRPLLVMGLRGMPVNPKRLEFHRRAADRLVRMAKAKLDRASLHMLTTRYESARLAVEDLEAEREEERASLRTKGQRAGFSKAAELTKARNRLKASFEALQAGFNFDSPPQRIALIEQHMGLPCPTYDGAKTTQDDKINALISRLQRGTIKPKSVSTEEAISLLTAMVAAKGWATWSRNFLQPPLIGA